MTHKETINLIASKSPIAFNEVSVKLAALGLLESIIVNSFTDLRIKGLHQVSQILLDGDEFDGTSSRDSNELQIEISDILLELADAIEFKANEYGFYIYDEGFIPHSVVVSQYRKTLSLVTNDLCDSLSIVNHTRVEHKNADKDAVIKEHYHSIAYIDALGKRWFANLINGRLVNEAHNPATGDSRQELPNRSNISRDGATALIQKALRTLVEQTITDRINQKPYDAAMRDEALVIKVKRMVALLGGDMAMYVIPAIKFVTVYKECGVEHLAIHLKMKYGTDNEMTDKLVSVFSTEYA